MPEDSLHCLIEIPKGSRNKYQWDEALGGIKLARFLFSSVVYPTDYGFVPDTRSPKGEALDAMVAVSEPTFPGCVIPVRAVGILRTEDERGQDDKLLCVPCDDPGWSHIEDLDHVPERMRTEIEHFFSIYKEPEGREVIVHGWEGRDVAEQVLQEARDRFRAAD
jgi:inorganic pyrophosphatase